MIHPFQDGNGRLSRVFTILLLLTYGCEYVPYCSLESIVEENKDAYYLALRRTQGKLNTDKSNYKPWLLFFLRTLQKQKNRLEQKIARKCVMVDLVSELLVYILTLVKERDRITISQLVALTGTSRNTLRLQLRKLVEKKYLTRYGAGRSTWYTLAK